MSPVKIEDKLFANRFRPHGESHLAIIDPAVCLKCADRPCTTFCPAKVYSWDDNRISIAFEGCLECGTCRIGCPFANIRWRYPKGGFGISHKFG